MASHCEPVLVTCPSPMSVCASGTDVTDLDGYRTRLVEMCADQAELSRAVQAVLESGLPMIPTECGILVALGHCKTPLLMVRLMASLLLSVYGAGQCCRDSLPGSRLPRNVAQGWCLVRVQWNCTH